MNGTLRKIEITDDLIMKVAREKFNACNKGSLIKKENMLESIGSIVLVICLMILMNL